MFDDLSPDQRARCEALWAATREMLTQAANDCGGSAVPYAASVIMGLGQVLSGQTSIQATADFLRNAANEFERLANGSTAPHGTA